MCFRGKLWKFLGFLVSQRGIKANPDKIQPLLDMKSPTGIKQVQSLIGRVAALSRLKDFVYKNIIYRFGIPHTIIIDNGKQFDSEDFRTLCEWLGIKKSFTAVYRPQANGQVEAMNKVIKHTIKKKLDDLKRRWTNELPEALWSYRTIARSSTGETLFSLSYRCEAMVPVEVGISLFRIEAFDEGANEDLLRLRLDLIEEHQAKS
ncbi:uncharacterized protein LOC116106019 [Pistacia vera]|uniref:uncharacterized protein LOC116106019 n=1 Tax=Pistacia vera TaxID=55513 RepID=UPI0012639BAE|nr:uncharacterized protein LOC116106019 [Pistacia vera]